MQLSTKARYATRALVELAIKSGQGPVKLKDISESQGISLKYLEQVMTPLRVSGYVKTHKGSRGGYTLSRPPDQINLFEIVQCVEGPLSVVDCLEDPELCSRVKLCATRSVWMGLRNAIYKELSKITLAELAEKQEILYRADQ
jgi:Rrf2 family protein